MMKLKDHFCFAVLAVATLAAGCASTSRSDAPGEAAPAAESLLGTWQGDLQEDPGGVDAPYPMILRIEEVDGQRFSGTIYWPTLSRSETEFEGSVVNGVLDIHENRLLRGRDILLGGHYYCFVSEDGRLRGRYVCPTFAEHSSLAPALVSTRDPTRFHLGGSVRLEGFVSTTAMTRFVAQSNAKYGVDGAFELKRQ